jgi:hypothetical protein
VSQPPTTTAAVPAQFAPNSVPATAAAPAPPDPEIDIQPFEIDPMILRPLRLAGAGPVLVYMIMGLFIGLAAIWTSAARGLFLRAGNAPQLPLDLWSFVLRGHRHGTDDTMPYLRDYPSLVLTVTIAAAVGLVYSLFRGASKLHSEMERNGCIAYGERGREGVVEEVKQLNEKLAKWGKFSPLALFICLLFMIILNLTLKDKLFTFLGPDLYHNWWASLDPIRPGGVAWVVFGAIGIYMVYVEAVLGMTYVGFLRRLNPKKDKNGQRLDLDKKFRFKANMLNPDGFFGWRQLRQLITNLQVGLLCTLLSAWAMSFFLEPAIRTIATVGMIATFVGVVTYVFVSVNVNFRHQVRRDKDNQRRLVIEDINRNIERKDAEGLLLVLLAYRRLEYIAQIPSTPVRQRFVVAGALSLIGPLSAIVVQLIKYFTG